MNYITIKGFEALTAQQVFDMAAKHVMTNGPSFRNGTCMYGGTGCAASVFIRPECRARVEGASWFTLTDENSVPPNNTELIRRMQGAHDHNAFAPSNFEGRFKREMQRIAADFGLDPRVLNN